MFNKAIDSIFNINSNFNLKYSDHTFAFLIIFIKNFILICFTLTIFILGMILAVAVLLVIFLAIVYVIKSAIVYSGLSPEVTTPIMIVGFILSVITYSLTSNTIKDIKDNHGFLKENNFD